MLAEDLRHRAAANRTVVDTDAARSVLICLSGPTLGSNPTAVLTATLNKLTEILGYELGRTGAGQAISPGHWATAEASPETWDGRLRLMLKEATDTGLLHDKLHGLPVWTGTNWCHIAVQHASVQPWTATHPAPGGEAVRGSGRPARH